MMDIFRLGAIALVAALSAVVLKKYVKELGVILSLVAGALILFQALGAMQGIRDMLDSLSETAGLSPAVLAPLLKTVGIAIVTKLTAELCRDADERGIAACVETAGAILALWVSVPLMKTVLSMILGLL